MIYTCPMHPEVQQDHPGNCPKCGMTLEPKTVTVGADDEENTELRDMTRRFWIGAALAHLIPAIGHDAWLMSDTSRWIQFALTTPVVCWAGWPFFQRGWRSVVTLHLNMFTLIAIGVGAAFVFSAVAMLAPGLFPTTMQHEGKVGCSVRCSNSAPAAARAAPLKRCSISPRPPRAKSPRTAIMKSRSTR